MSGCLLNVESLCASDMHSPSSQSLSSIRLHRRTHSSRRRRGAPSLAPSLPFPRCLLFSWATRISRVEPQTPLSFAARQTATVSQTLPMYAMVWKWAGDGVGRWAEDQPASSPRCSAAPLRTEQQRTRRWASQPSKRIHLNPRGHLHGFCFFYGLRRPLVGR